MVNGSVTCDWLVQEGKRWLLDELEAKTRMLVLADAQGLGKSTQVICAVAARADPRTPVLVVCHRERYVPSMCTYGRGDECGNQCLRQPAVVLALPRQGI